MEASSGSNSQSSAKPGEIFTQPDSTEVRAGFDGEVFPVRDTGEVFDFLWEELGVEIQDDLIRIGKNEAVDVQIIDVNSEPPSILKHRWSGGLYITCPKHTSPELLDEVDRGRDCPLCDSSVPVILEFLIPVILRARKNAAGTWRDELRQRAKILRLTRGATNRFLERDDKASTVLVVGRNNDRYGTYFVENSQIPPVTIKCSGTPKLRRQRVESDEELQSLWAVARKIAGLELTPGRVAKWQTMFPHVPLIAIWPGRKKPVRSGYLDPAKRGEWMRDDNYLRQMDEGQGIALLLVNGYVAIDLDRDEDIAEFEQRNLWAKNCMSTRGGRGLKYFVKIKGEYPQRVLHVFAGKEHVGEFRGATLAVLDNIHPSGKLYEVRHEGNVVEITYDQIQWPEGWKLESPKCREFERGFDEHIEGGLLEVRLLKNVRPHPTKAGALQAQCPACAESGSDKSGNHLILFDGGSGPFGCVVDQSPEHYARVFELAKRDCFRQRERNKETVERLAALDLMDYDQQRGAAAAELCIRTSTLDQMVAAKRQELGTGGEAKLFTVAEPWPEPVDGEALIDDLVQTLRKFMVLTDAGYVAVAIWILLSYCFDLFQYSPILSVRSPDKQCGKSTLLKLLGQLVLRPLSAANVTDAVLYRAIAKWSPVLMLDEWDSQRPEMQEAIRNVLNSGFEKGGCTWRCVGDDYEPTPFPTYCPKVVAGIGELPDTAASRAITITLHRRLPHEKVERLRGFDGLELRRKCVRWVQDNLEQLRAARPALPEELGDRQQDIWEPMFAVGDLCGAWANLARVAALNLCQKVEGESLAVELLKDIRRAFGLLGDDEARLSTEDLLKRLNDLADRPWPTLCDGRPLNAHRLSRMLARFEIAPRTVRIGRITPKGYYSDQFEDAWARYLPDLQRGVPSREG